MKRLIVCCDGTWQTLISPYPTNVIKLAQAIQSSDRGIPQIVFYDEGVGAGNMAERFFAEGDKILGGAFGIGIDNNIQDAFRFLSLNYEPGDEIYLFGFSRGAYTVRSLAGLIRCSGGLLSLKNIREAPLAYELYRDRSLTLPEKEAFRRLPLSREYQPDVAKIKELRTEAHRIYSDRSFISLKVAESDPVRASKDLQRKQESVRQLLQRYGFSERNDADIRQPTKITLLACWDTVGSLGVPTQIPFVPDWINEKYKFHDTFLSTIIQNALHAVAIDERRAVFNVTPMMRQAIDSQPLRQVWFPGDHGSVGGGNKAKSGLSDGALAWMMAQITKPQPEGLGLGLALDPIAVEDGIHPNYKIDFDSTPAGFYKFLGEIWRDIPLGQFGALHETAKQRYRDRPDYRPPNLAIYAQDLRTWIATTA